MPLNQRFLCGLRFTRLLVKRVLSQCPECPSRWRLSLHRRHSQVRLTTMLDSIRHPLSLCVEPKRFAPKTTTHDSTSSAICRCLELQAGLPSGHSLGRSVVRRHPCNPVATVVCARRFDSCIPLQTRPRPQFLMLSVSWHRF